MDEDYDRHVQAVQFLKKAESLYELCDVSSMGPHLERSLELDRTLGRTWELMGLFSLGEMDLEKAEECFGKAVSLKGVFQDAVSALSLMEKDGWPSGREIIDQVQGILALGQLFLSQARWKPAYICFSGVESYVEPDWRYYSILGLIHRELDMLEPSLANYDRAASMHGAPVELEHDRALILMKLGRLEEAEETFRTVLDGVEGVPQILHNLGTVLEAQGRDGEAMEAYDKALDIEDDYYPSLYSKGRLLQKIGEMERARVILGKALDIEGRVYDLGDVTGKEGRQEDGHLHVKEVMGGRREKDHK